MKKYMIEMKYFKKNYQFSIQFLYAYKYTYLDKNKKRFVFLLYRRKAFDVNMTKDYVLYNISIDNPDLVTYIRNIQLKTSHQDLLNATKTLEEQFIINQLQGKREGIYFEYLSRVSIQMYIIDADTNKFYSW
jgi:hypothetical protein